MRRFLGLIVGFGEVETEGGVISVEEVDGEHVILISAVSKCSGNWTNLYTNFCPFTFLMMF